MERNHEPSQNRDQIAKVFDRVGKHSPQRCPASYKLYKVIVRDNGRLMPIAFVKDDFTIEWNDASNVPAMVDGALPDFTSDREYGLDISRFCDGIDCNRERWR